MYRLIPFNRELYEKRGIFLYFLNDNIDMPKEKIIKGEVGVGLDAETLELLDRLRREEMQSVSSYLRKVIRMHVMSEAAKRGWLRGEEAPKPYHS
jgi:hypothetical protein